MKFSLAFVLVDLGDPWYKTAASEMIRSARRAYKDHDMNVVQITDSKTAHHPDADAIFNLDIAVGKEQMCQFKGFAIAQYALQAERPVIFCDVDIIWNNANGLRYLEPGVSCLWREDMPSMPINTGIILSDGLPEFWEVYRAACDNLPPQVSGWYGDQFAILVAWIKIGENRDEFAPPEARKLKMDAFAPAIDELPTAPLTTPAVHFKGQRKHLMVPYARMLDGGSAFDFARPNQMKALEPDYSGIQQQRAEEDDESDYLDEVDDYSVYDPHEKENEPMDWVF